MTRWHRASTVPQVSLVDEATVVARASRVVLRQVTSADEQEFIRLANDSLGLHQPWIYAPRTPTEFADYVGRFEHTSAEGFLVCLADTQAIAGFINLNEVVLGPYLRGLLGYGVFQSSAGQGYMTEGLRAATRYAFEKLELHRLEADIQPGNSRSIDLVRRIGFSCECVSPGYIRINGQWKDHQRWVLLSDVMR